MQIKNENLKKAILTALADKEMLQILNSAKEKLVSGNEIIKKFDIPHSTAYRKIKWMLENELLEVEKMDFTEDGKKFSLFRSTISSASVKYEGEEVTVEAERSVNVVENTTKRFFSMEDPS
jgi:DNA-binding transcriptional ArsR family regulator